MKIEEMKKKLCLLMDAVSLLEDFSVEINDLVKNWSLGHKCHPDLEDVDTAYFERFANLIGLTDQGNHIDISEYQWRLGNMDVSVADLTPEQTNEALIESFKMIQNISKKLALMQKATSKVDQIMSSVMSQSEKSEENQTNQPS